MFNEVTQEPVGIETSCFGSFDNAFERCACLCTVRAAGEKSVFPADYEMTDRILDEIVVNVYPSIGLIDKEFGPLLQGIADSLTEMPFRRNLMDPTVKSALECINTGPLFLGIWQPFQFP